MDTEKSPLHESANTATQASATGATTSGSSTKSVEKEIEATEKKTEKRIEEDLNITPTPSQVGNIIMSLVMAILGLVFIWLCDRHVIGTTVLIAGGLAFIIPGAALMLSLLARRKNQTRGSVMTFITAICGLGAIALGVVILVAPDSFRHLLVYLFGGLLIISAAWEFDVMVRKNRGILYPAWLIVAPILIVALGVVMFTMDAFKGESNEKWMLLATGCGFTLFGIIGLFISYYAIKTTHTAKKLAKAAAKAAKAATPSTQPSPTNTATSTTNPTDKPTGNSTDNTAEKPS